MTGYMAPFKISFLIFLMELHNDLQFLIERAWGLVNKVNDEILSNQSVSFCKLCSENGHLCGIADTTWEEKESLIAIRDSLKDVQNILEFLQRSQLGQKSHHNLALAKLEESRMTLIGKVNEYKSKGRQLEVIEELNAKFGKNFETKDEADFDVKRNKTWSCIRNLFNPWLAIKLIVISISISSSYNFYKGRVECKSSEREVLVWPLDLVKGGKHDFRLKFDPNRPLDVLHGRG